MSQFVIFVRDVEERLGWNAADVETGSSQSTSFFDADGIDAELSSLDRCNVAFLREDVPPGPPPITARSNDRLEKL